MTPETSHIEKLLEKYFDAETTLQEEALLKNYFTSDKVADHLKLYQGMFSYFSENQSEKFPSAIRLKSENTRRYWFRGVAAGLALLLGSVAINRYIEHQKAEKALADTKMAFEIIGKQLNKGNKAIQELDNVEKTKVKAYKSSQHLSLLMP